MPSYVSIWDSYYKWPLDTLRRDSPAVMNTYQWVENRSKIRTYFFNCDWNEVYDFVEFVARNYWDGSANQGFMEYCNKVLQQEVSAYRFVVGKITQITSEEEIAEVEGALKATEPLKPVHQHLEVALHLLSDKKSPDYRNSTNCETMR